MTPSVKLKPYISQIRGITYKPDEIADAPFENSVPLLKANNITDDGLDHSSLIYIDSNRIKPEQFIRAGDLLLAASSGSKKAIGKSAYFTESFGGSFGAFCKVVRPKNGLCSDYLKHFFKTSYYRSSIEKAVQGANINNLRNEHLDDLEIPLPLVDDQIRIAYLLGKVEALIAQRKQHLQQLDDLLKSAFLEMFGDPIVNPRGFPVRRLSEFYINPKEGTKCGPFGSALRKEELVESGVPVWNMDNIGPGGQMVLPFRMWITTDKYDDLAAYSVRDGDIVISRAGTVGKMCVVYMHGQPAIISTNLIRLRLGSALRPLHFVSLMLYCKGRVGRLKTGADGAFTHMNTGVLDSLEFPYPPIERQDQFAEIATKVESNKAHYQQSLADLEALYGTLSQQAFKGELDLSRVPLPDDQGSQTHGKQVEQQADRSPLPEGAVTPTEVINNLVQGAQPQGRAEMLARWFSRYLANTSSDASLGSAQLLQAAWQTLQETQLEEDGETPALTLDDYDALKDWVFKKLASSELGQTFVGDSNRVALQRQSADWGTW